MAHFTDLIDLAAERLGGAVLVANDEFFAPKEALLKASPAEWREGEYTDRGKWMDGWETRRRRSPSTRDDHDWCVIRLGAAEIVKGIDVDTAFFTGNFPESCAIDVGSYPGHPSTPQRVSGGDWREILSRSPLNGDAHN